MSKEFFFILFKTSSGLIPSSLGSFTTKTKKQKLKSITCSHTHRMDKKASKFIRKVIDLFVLDPWSVTNMHGFSVPSIHRVVVFYLPF